MPVIIRDLSKVEKLVFPTLGLGVSHAYEDLVILEHSVAIVQFDDNDQFHFKIWFNKDLEPALRADSTVALSSQAAKLKLRVSFPGSFSVGQKEEVEELEISFLPT